MVEQHTTVVQCIGKVPLRGLIDLDNEIELRLLDDRDGNSLASIHRSSRQVMTNHKINRVRLWQYIASAKGGGCEGVYTNTRGCLVYKSMAEQWSEHVGVC